LLLTMAFLASVTWPNLVAGALALALGAILYRFRRPVAPVSTDAQAVGEDA
jgi:hypothetical protein